jgi:hypothetical protein
MYKKQENRVEEIEFKELNIAGFYKEFLVKNKPILITKIFEQIPSLSSCSIEFLIEKLGNKTVKVNTSDTGIFDLDPQTGKSPSEPIYISFKEYIDKLLHESNGNNRKLYMQQISINNSFPELKDKIIFDQYLPSDVIKVVNLWVGSGGNTSPLHYDPLNNFFMQLFGNKKFLLYDPMQFSNLYPNSCLSKTPHISKIDAVNVDIIKHPKALKAKPIEVIISSGNILFIPAYWWHYVYSIDINISVNMWCKTSLRQKFVPGYFHDKFNSLYNILRWSLPKN